MCDFKVGDEVVCILSEDLPWQIREDAGSVSGLVEGAVYTVRAIEPCGIDYEDIIVVRFVETANIDDFGRCWGYLPIRFRKVQRRDFSIEKFTSIPVGDTSRWDKSKKRECA